MISHFERYFKEHNIMSRKVIYHASECNCHLNPQIMIINQSWISMYHFRSGPNISRLKEQYLNGHSMTIQDNISGLVMGFPLTNKINVYYLFHVQLPMRYKLPQILHQNVDGLDGHDCISKLHLDIPNYFYFIACLNNFINSHIFHSM